MKKSTHCLILIATLMLPAALPKHVQAGPYDAVAKVLKWADPDGRQLVKICITSAVMLAIYLKIDTKKYTESVTKVISKLVNILPLLATWYISSKTVDGIYHLIAKTADKNAIPVKQ